MKTLTVPVAPDIEPRLQAIADRRGISLERLIEEALTTYVVHDAFALLMGIGEVKH
ncbi:hypothetical protein SAMN06297251_10418 [Fulvimarina manganoxydans]|uniref:Ribbon-helix-helix protein, copG family n=1 Tax=Fulvimarina manganoxydans TaxID=937218 RepID=A0A1W2A858_9HYPH|nr:hypothetical protein [Fulvimarina manganoxydans]SMC56773.1 hypothetical protein SAMN06297251_10418 [Fulvimarina manganoxydans]